MIEHVTVKLTGDGESRTDGATGAVRQTANGSNRETDAGHAGSESGRTDESESDADGRHGASLPAIGLDEIFGLLKNRRRRDVLRHLDGDADRISLGELAERIAARECDKDVAHVTSTERKRVYVGLYQCHLPKMADMGAVTYNKPRGIIEPGPNVERFRYYLPETEDVVEAQSPTRTLVQSLADLVR